MSDRDAYAPTADGYGVATRQDRLEPGSRAGEYEIVDELGEGGFGTVYRGIHPVIGKRVAIKVLKAELSSNRDMVARFVAEARAVNKIQHEHIIDIFAFGKLDDGRSYFVMDLLDGSSLQDVLASGSGRLTIDETVSILRDVAGALDAAHAAGIAHRDLKPDNVFVCRGGKVKLLDFGIAKLLEDENGSTTTTGTPIGTPLFMSPEQGRGISVDARTDVYSFGVMTYRMLTGEFPLVGKNFVDLAFKHANESPPAPSEVCAELPQQLDAPILSMMAKSPDDRPTTAGEALATLEAAAADAGIELAVRPPAPDLTGARQDIDPSAPTQATPRGVTTSAAFGVESVAVETATPSRRRSVLVAAGGVALVAIVAVVAVMTRTDSAKDAADDSPVAEVTPDARSQAAAAVAPIAPPVEAPADAAPPEAVTLSIDGVPPGTDVVAPDGTVLGTAPGDVSVPYGTEPVELTLKNKGFHTAKYAVTPSAAASVSWSLREIERPSSTPATKPPPKEPEKSGPSKYDFEGEW